MNEPRAPAKAKAKAKRCVAATQLATEHGKAVFGFCMHILRDQGLAEDVAQQVFLEAYRDLDRFEERSAPRTWLFGIASHRCLDALKSQQRRLQRIESNDDAMLEFADPGEGAIDHINHAQLNAALAECLALLSPEVRATVLLRFQTGLTYEEMAAELSATPAALQVRVSRAMPALRRCLESKGWTGE